VGGLIVSVGLGKRPKGTKASLGQRECRKADRPRGGNISLPGHISQAKASKGYSPTFGGQRPGTAERGKV